MTSDTSRIPPRDALAEQAVLCGVLVRPEVMADVMTVCDGTDFYQVKNQCVFEAMVRLWSESSPIDAITLIDALRRAGDFDKGADDKYVLEIVASNVDVPAMAPVHARIVHELALKRSLAAAATKIASAAFDGADSTTLISEAQQALDELRERQKRAQKSTAHYLHEAVEQLDDIAADAFSTGFPGLDRALAGGFRAGQLITVAGPTSRGKSAFALNVAAHVARNAGGALMFSLEMSERELARRLLFSEAQVAHALTAEKISEGARERIQHAADQFANLKFEFQYRPGLTPSILRAVAQQFARKWDGNLKLIVADYIGLMRPNSPQERREREVAAITRELKLIAGELGCAVLGVAQLNREITHREGGLPRLSDLRDSGAVEQDSDVVMFLAEREGTTSLIIQKSRSGPLATVPLTFRASMTRFEDAA